MKSSESKRKNATKTKQSRKQAQTQNDDAENNNSNNSIEQSSNAVKEMYAHRSLDALRDSYQNVQHARCCRVMYCGEIRHSRESSSPSSLNHRNNNNTHTYNDHAYESEKQRIIATHKVWLREQQLLVPMNNNVNNNNNNSNVTIANGNGHSNHSNNNSRNSNHVTGALLMVDSYVFGCVEVDQLESLQSLFTLLCDDTKGKTLAVMQQRHVNVTHNHNAHEAMKPMMESQKSQMSQVSQMSHMSHMSHMSFMSQHSHASHPSQHDTTMHSQSSNSRSSTPTTQSGMCVRMCMQCMCA